MPTSTVLSEEEERAERHLAFSNALRQFCASDTGTVAAPNLWQTLKSRPSKYICSPIMAIEVTADLFIEHPRLAENLGGLVTLMCRLYSKNPGSQNVAAAVWSLCTRYARPAKSWAKSKMVELELDENDSKRVGLEKQKTMVGYQTECTNTLNLLRNNIDDPGFEIVSIETAARVLQLLLHHSSQTVATVVDRAMDGKIARTAGWAVATAASAGLVTASIMFMPVATPFALELGCSMVSGGFLGYSGASTFCDGANVIVTRRHCKEACQVHADIAQNVKAYCLFLAYLYHKKASLDHLNDASFVSQVKETNERLRGDPIQWHEPEYVQNYIVSAGEEMDHDFKKLLKALKAIRA